MDVAAVEVREGGVHRVDEDSAIVEDVEAEAAWAGVEASLVEARPGAVAEAASGVEALRAHLRYFMVFRRFGDTTGRLATQSAKGGFTARRIAFRL